MNKQDETATSVEHENKIEGSNSYVNSDILLDETVSYDDRKQNTNVTSLASDGNNNTKINNCISILLMKIMNSKDEHSCLENVTSNDEPFLEEKIRSLLVENNGSGKSNMRFKNVANKVNKQDMCYDEKLNLSENIIEQVEVTNNSKQNFENVNCTKSEVKNDGMGNNREQSTSNQESGENECNQEPIIDRTDQNISIEMNRDSTTIQRGILFLNKKRKFLKNLIFARRVKISHNNIKTKHQVDGSSKSLNSIADFDVEEISKPKFYSTIEISKDDDTKSQVSNNEICSKSNTFKEIDTIDQSDCEMVILFMNHGKELQKVTLNKRDVENTMNEANGIHDITPLTKEKSDILKAKLRSLEHIKCADKTTSTSNLKLYSKTNLEANEIIICSPTTSKSEPNDITEQCLSKNHIGFETDIGDSCKETSDLSFLLEPDKYNHKININEIDEKKIEKVETQTSYNNVTKKKMHIQIDNPTSLEQTINKMSYYTNFVNPHVLVSNNTQGLEECKLEKARLSNLYASFKKNYIPVTSQTGTLNSQSSDCSRSDCLKTEDTSSVSCTSNNNQTTDCINISDYIFNRDAVQNKKKFNNSDSTDAPCKVDEVVNTKCDNFMYNQDSKACLNILNHKLQFFNKLYTQNMRKTFQSYLVNDHNSIHKEEIVERDSEYDYKNGSNVFMDEDVDKDWTKCKDAQYSTDNKNNIIKLNGYSSNFQTDLICKKSISRNGFKSDILRKTVYNDINNSLLSRQFKRDYISVRGKSLKIKHTDNSIVTHKTRHFKLMKEKSIYNIEKIYKEISNDTYKFTRDEIMKKITPFSVEKIAKSKSSLSSNEHGNNRTVKLSSKLSLCISQESIDEELYDDIPPVRFLDSNPEKHSSSDEENVLKNHDLTYLEHKRPVFPRIYSDFSIENKCNPKAYKYLFNNFHK